jgi:hypothetical protein
LTKKKYAVLVGILLKALGFLLAGVLVSMALLADYETLSWFSSRVVGDLEVRAASEQDIIAEVYTTKNGKKTSRNPDSLVIVKNPELQSDPWVYFEVADQNNQLLQYVLHINPVKLDKPRVEVPINYKIHFYEFPRIKGYIKLYCYNKFIDRETPIELDVRLFSSAGEDLNNIRNMNIASIDYENEVKNYILNYIIALAGKLDWNEVRSPGRAERFGAASGKPNGEKGPENISPAPTEIADEENGRPVFAVSSAVMARARLVQVANIFSRPELTADQISVIDIVAPKLREYIDALYNYVEGLIALLNEKMAEINELYLKIDDLNLQLDGFARKYVDLEQEKVKLAEENLILNEKIEKLGDRIDDLDDENDSLLEIIRALKDEKARLQDENRRLKEEIESLKNEPSASGGLSGNDQQAPGDGVDPGEAPAGGEQNPGDNVQQPPAAENSNPGDGTQPPSGDTGDPGDGIPSSNQDEDQGPGGEPTQPPAGDSP